MIFSYLLIGSYSIEVIKEERTDWVWVVVFESLGNVLFQA